MRHSNLFLSALVFVMLMGNGCKKLDDLQKDPNAIPAAGAELLFTGLELGMFNGPWNGDQRNNQFYTLNEAYYGNQDYAFGAYDFSTNYNQLRNIGRMELEAAKKGEAMAKPYLALAKFFRAYYYVTMTEMLGDVPMAEAMKADSGKLFKPKYDQQETVYRQCLQWLEEANADLAQLSADKTLTIGGDVFYKGDLAKWRKAVNSYRLRVLLGLSHRATELNVKQQFAAIVGKPEQYPLISDANNTENLQINYNSTTKDNYYPLWPSDGIVIKKDLRNHIASTYIDILKATRDPRLFIVALPTDSALNSGDPDYATKFSSFRGANPGDLQTTIKDQALAGKLSNLNFDYWVASPTGVPCIQLGAAETAFNIAEGINRGWTAGDAGAYYRKGITASMQFYGVKKDEVDAFLQATLNVYAGDNEAGLRQILSQKYVAFFQNSGRQAFYEQRRTGWPVFAVGPGNGNNSTIPVRWSYPSAEYTTNEGNVKEALQRQYNGSDSRNDVMWLLK
jgi:hypothetical protein